MEAVMSVATICFVTDADVSGRPARFTDIHVTRDHLEQLRDRVVAYLESLDEGASAL